MTKFQEQDKKINESKKLENDINKILKYCKKKESELFSGSAVFYPAKEDVYIYEEIVERGIMKRSPAGKGYLLVESYEKIWGGDVVEKIVNRPGQPKA
jgi:hypothetical protein